MTVSDADEWQRIFQAAGRRGDRRTGPPQPRQGLGVAACRELGERVAAAIAADAGEVWPVPVEEVAARLGFELVIVRQVADGCMPDANGNVILLRDGVSHVRSRFTVAHELAHSRLARNSAELLRGIARELADEEEERVCNAAAAALLVPQARVDGLIEGSPPDAKVMLRAAALAGVSPATLLNRLTQLSVWECVLVGWTPTHEHVRAREVSGGPWSARGWRATLRHVTALRPLAWASLDIATPHGPTQTQCQRIARRGDELWTLVTAVKSRNETEAST